MLVKFTGTPTKSSSAVRQCPISPVGGVEPFQMTVRCDSCQEDHSERGVYRLIWLHVLHACGWMRQRITASPTIGPVHSLILKKLSSSCLMAYKDRRASSTVGYLRLTWQCDRNSSSLLSSFAFYGHKPMSAFINLICVDLWTKMLTS